MPDALLTVQLCFLQSRASRSAPSAPLITVTPRFTDYELHESPIGFGTESTVYLARHVPNDTFVALKCIVLEDEEATGGARRSSADKFDDVVVRALFLNVSVLVV